MIARLRTLYRLLLLATLIVSGRGALAASDVVTVRSGDHPGFGRIVIDSPAHYKMERIGDRVVVQFTDAIRLGHAPSAPHNVTSVQTTGTTVEFVVAAGAEVKPSIISGLVVFDITDPSSNPPSGTPNPPKAANQTNKTPAASEQANKPQASPAAAASASTASAALNTGSASRPDDKPQQAPGAATAAPAASHAAAALKASEQSRPVAQSLKLRPAPLAQSAMTGSPELGGRASLPPAPGPQAAGGPAPADTPAPGTAPSVAVTARPLPPPGDAATDAALHPVQPEAPGRDVMPENAGQLGLMALPARVPKGFEGSAFVVPFSNATGAAAFRRDAGTFVVFDERRPVDMSPMHDDPVFGHADVQLLAGGTLLRLPLPAGMSVAVSQTPRGWRISALKVEPKSQPITPAYADGAINLAAEQPSEVLSIADPDTGASLLVGTTRRPNQAVLSVRRGTEFILPRTILGVVVEPLSDAVALKVIPTGFTLTGRPSGLAVSPPSAETDAQMDAVYLTRRFEFPVIPTDALLRTLIRQGTDIAMTPPRARGPKRQAAALTMIALGMAAEAESLLRDAAERDPQLAASPDVAGLTAIAAILAGRLREADGLNDPRLTGTDDIALWRAVRQAMQDEGSPAAAVVFASTAPLAMLYPKPIRDRILPLIVETMVQGGQVGQAERFLAKLKADVRLGYARALQKIAEGDTDQALAILDGIAAGHDQFDRARAAVRAVELRLSSQKLTPAQAADALDKLVFAWRGDQRELNLRERIADLREHAGEWRTALATLRQAEADFPDQGRQVHALMQDAFAKMVAGHDLAQMTPIDVVSAIDENADLIPPKDGNPVLEEQLAERLLALDLPDRARPVLDKLMKSAASPTGKARFGATLAALDVQEKDDPAALAVLDASETQNLPADLAEKRMLLRADAMARTGNPAGAVAALQALGTPAATEARAAILEQNQDWAGAERAWSDYATTALPETGILDDGQSRALLRLTTAAARAGDEAMLANLRASYNTRLNTGAFADMFRLLTAEPVRGTGDLQRSRQEATLAQSLPADLKALDGSTPTH